MSLKKATKWMSTASLALLLAACGGGEEATNDAGTDGGAYEGASGDFDASTEIHVITREEGSGTRDAFTEIAGVVDENGDDMTVQTATVQNGTNAVMQGVAGDVYSIGYISLGSLDDSVKALAVNGVEATPENVQTGDYEVARNFNVTYGGELSDVAQDFWNFMFSSQAQEIVEDEGYVAAETDAPEYEAQAMSGDITIVGSTSVEPVMVRISEAYQEYNPDVTIEITAPGSGAGVTAAIDGTADIGMASRELDEEEQSQVTETAPIAVDGIAVIVNQDNPSDEMALEDIGGIYTGDITTWDQVGQ
jgi:phosphate transport system substrate-binding protein